MEQYLPLSEKDTRFSDNFTPAPVKISDNFTPAPVKISDNLEISCIFATDKKITDHDTTIV